MIAPSTKESIGGKRRNLLRAIRTLVSTVGLLLER
jgi:hypothetical protein